MWLVICPRFDEATEYSYMWAQEIVETLQNLKIPCTVLAETDAVKANVEKVLKENTKINVIHYDHGSEDAIYGNDAQPVIDLTNNKLLANRECFNMNCLSAKTLGADSYLRYATTYWGSIKEITFTTTALEAFQKALNYPILMRLNGETDWNTILDATLENDAKIVTELIENNQVLEAAVLLTDSNSRRVYTDKTPPEDQDSTCTFRKIALKLFGQKGWRIPNPFH
jgi:hypothetical protein